MRKSGATAIGKATRLLVEARRTNSLAAIGGVGEANAVAGGRAEHLGIGLSCDFHFSAPITFPLNPNTFLLPERETNSTVRACPGSKRTAVPEAMLSRQP